MKTRDDETMKVTLETNRGTKRGEMHLFDNDARKENAICGADTSSRRPGGRGGGASPACRRTLERDLPVGPCMRQFLRFSSAAAATPYRPTRWSPSVGEQVAETQASGKLQQRLPVLVVGPRSAISPSPYGVAIGLQPAGDLRPRQARLLLEPPQTLREVGGDVVGFSLVEYALSRHRTKPSRSTAGDSLQSGCKRPLSCSPRP